jgi:hypothetical protein
MCRALSAAVAALVIGVGVANAQSDQERAGARAAATQGAEAFKAEKYKDAINYFKRAESLVHAPPHLLFIARANEKLGKLVEAREAYMKIVRERLKPTDPDAFREAQSTAEAELGKLEPRIPSINIQVEGAEGRDVTVTMDGNEVPSALLGVPMPIDPGEHVFEAKAVGLQPVSQTVSVSEGAKESVQLALTTEGGGESARSSAESDVTLDTGAPAAGGGLRVPAYISLGVGAVGLGVGTFMLIKSGSTRSDADGLFETCNPRICNNNEKNEINSLDDDADSQHNLGVAGLVIGGIGVAAGVTLLVMSGSSSSSEKLPSQETAAVRPWVGWRSVGLTGRF